MARLIVLGAGVLIAYLDENDDHHCGADELLTRAMDDEFGANSLTLAEMLVVPVWLGRPQTARGSS